MTIDVVVIGAVAAGGPIAAARERIDLSQASSRAPLRINDTEITLDPDIPPAAHNDSRHGSDPAQGADELADRHPGHVLQVAADRERGKYHGQVRLDRVTLVVEDWART